MEMNLSYVLGVALNPATSQFVGLTKLKGPPFLIGRRTFPGGKREGNETPQVAISREVFEETGVYIPPEAWTIFEEVQRPEYSLYKLVANSPDVATAYQKESEPVWVSDIDTELGGAVFRPSEYVDDFISTLSKAIAV